MNIYRTPDATRIILNPKRCKRETSISFGDVEVTLARTSSGTVWAHISVDRNTKRTKAICSRIDRDGQTSTPVPDTDNLYHLAIEFKEDP